MDEQAKVTRVFFSRVSFACVCVDVFLMCFSHVTHSGFL